MNTNSHPLRIEPKISALSRELELCESAEVEVGREVYEVIDYMSELSL